MARASRVVDEVLSAVEAAAGEIVDFTCRLIRIPTVNPPGDAYDDCARELGAELQACGFESSTTCPRAGPSTRPRTRA
jgi:succinyl-diaminopimelate desuccinylase